MSIIRNKGKGRLSMICVVLFVSVGCGAFFAADARAQQSGGDCAQLKKDYDALKLEHDNTLAQTQALIKYKNKAGAMEDALRQADVVKGQLIKEKEEALSQVAQLQEKVKGMDTMVVKAAEERDAYKKSFEKASVENIIGEEAKKKTEDQKKEQQTLAQRSRDLEARILAAQQASLKDKVEIESCRRQLLEAKERFEAARQRSVDLAKKLEEAPKEVAALYEKEGAVLKRQIEELESRLRLAERASLKEQTQTEFYKQQIAEVKKKYEDAKQQNRALERKLDSIPKKFAELARENKVLVKRTSTMHYNLGVFYTQNKEFDRAVAEFEKAAELNPEDSASYFNLGYIYAEHLLNRPRAVMHFKRFLKLAKRDDKDADWAKRYILTWQTWEGSEPIK
jgi:chromosome segregation ATPase